MHSHVGLGIVDRGGDRGVPKGDRDGAWLDKKNGPFDRATDTVSECLVFADSCTERPVRPTRANENDMNDVN